MSDKQRTHYTRISWGAYGQALIGGNHLANSLIAYGCMPAEQTDYEQVLHQHGPLCADMWIAWKAIMDMRECVENG
jgi:hypothetical protein